MSASPSEMADVSLISTVSPSASAPVISSDVPIRSTFTPPNDASPSMPPPDSAFSSGVAKPATLASAKPATRAHCTAV